MGLYGGFPGGAGNLPANARDLGSIPGLGRSLGGGRGNPLQYSCLENPTDEDPGGLEPIVSQGLRHDKRLSTHMGPSRDEMNSDM